MTVLSLFLIVAPWLLVLALLWVLLSGKPLATEEQRIRASNADATIHAQATQIARLIVLPTPRTK